MKKQNYDDVITDLSFIAILTLMFIGIFFLSMDQMNSLTNGIFLCIAIVIFVITYFTTMLAGLTINVALIFLLTAYRVIVSADTGTAIPPITFFWILWTPLMTIAISLFISKSKKIIAENNELYSELENYSVTDPISELKNFRGYEFDAATYMKIASRYKMNLQLILWKLKYEEDFFRIIGVDYKDEVIKRISSAITDCLRTEDSLYAMKNNPMIWGTLAFSTEEGIRIITNRIQEKVNSLDFSDLTYSSKSLPLSITYGIGTYSSSSDTPLSLSETAEQRLLFSSEETKTPASSASEPQSNEENESASETGQPLSDHETGESQQNSNSENKGNEISEGNSSEEGKKEDNPL